MAQYTLNNTNCIVNFYKSEMEKTEDHIRTEDKIKENSGLKKKPSLKEKHLNINKKKDSNVIKTKFNYQIDSNFIKYIGMFCGRRVMYKKKIEKQSNCNIHITKGGLVTIEGKEEEIRSARILMTTRWETVEKLIKKNEKNISNKETVVADVHREQTEEVRIERKKDSIEKTNPKESINEKRILKEKPSYNENHMNMNKKKVKSVTTFRMHAHLVKSIGLFCGSTLEHKKKIEADTNTQIDITEEGLFRVSGIKEDVYSARILITGRWKEVQKIILEKIENNKPNNNVKMVAEHREQIKEVEMERNEDSIEVDKEN